MSYSFSARAASKGEVMAAVAHQLDNVVASQPVHEKDRAAAHANIDAALALLNEDESRDIVVNAHGSIVTLGDDVRGVSIGVNVSLMDRINA